MTLGERNVFDCHLTGGWTLASQNLLDLRFAFSVFHAGDGDMRREGMSLLFEAEFDHFVFDSLVQCLHVIAAYRDTEPDDRDIIELGKHAEVAEFGDERIDTGALDATFEGLFDRIEAILAHVAEELERHMCLGGIRRPHPRYG